MREESQTRVDSPRGGKSSRTRERILDATAYVLCRRGFAGTRLSDVAERADCQAPAIYYYFDSREDLIEEVVYQGVLRLHDHVRGELERLSDASPALKLNTALEAHLRFVLLESDYTMAAIRNAAQMPLDLRARQLAELQKYTNLWRGLFREARSAGLLRPGVDERLARMLLLGALNWTVEWWQARGESLETLMQNARVILNFGFLISPDDEA